MTTADDYLRQVLDRMPAGTPRREQIVAELRSHIAERLGHGQPLDHVLRQLGDPAALAESYLAEIPLARAPLGSRALAKLVDIFLVVGACSLLMVPAIMFASVWRRFEVLPLALALLVLAGSLLFGAYTVLAEWLYGYTIGKRALGLRVVQESGAQIGLGQAIVRQLPAPLQIYWIDVLFALFTDKQQRAFELLSKTRVVTG